MFRFRPMSSKETANWEAEERKLEEWRDMEERFGPISSVGNNLKKFRKQCNYSKTEMAEIMGVTPRSYFDYEADKRGVSSDALRRLASFTGVDLNKILLGRPAGPNLTAVDNAISDMCTALQTLNDKYPEMRPTDRIAVARKFVTTNWDGQPRFHPDCIKSSVMAVTGYRFHMEELPAPPFHEDYGDNQDQHDKDLVAWYKLVQEATTAIDVTEIAAQNKKSDET